VPLFFFSSTRGSSGAAAESVREAALRSRKETGNVVWDWFYYMKHWTPYLLNALLTYDKVTSSCVYMCNKAAGGLYLIWGGWGVYISIENIIEDTTQCDSRSIVSYMHFLSFLYVLFFTVSLISFILWLAAFLSGSSFVSNMILKAAMKMDDANDMGLPLFVTLVKSFVLRSAVDNLAMQRHAVKEEISELQKRLEFNAGELQEFFKVHVLQSQSLGKVVVGMSGIPDASAKKPKARNSEL